MTQSLAKTLRELAAELAKTMQCTCDLDRWEPEPSTGHSWVCGIHKAAVSLYSRQPQPPPPPPEPVVAKVGRGGAWFDFKDLRPPLGPHWFRAPGKPLAGGYVPEWVDDVALVGMGRASNQAWPRFSHWDGYKRTVWPTLQWREVLEGEPTAMRVPGLELQPCPFCGRVPAVDFCGRWIGATVLDAEWFTVKCCGMVPNLHRESMPALAARWNLRAAASANPPKPVAYLHALHMEAGQMRREVTFDQRHPFGARGIDFHRGYIVTTIPLYANLPPAAEPEPAEPEPEPMGGLFDVVAIDIKTRDPRLLADRKTKASAEAIIKMAVIRRGVDSEFFAMVPHPANLGAKWGE